MLFTSTTYLHPSKHSCAYFSSHTTEAIEIKETGCNTNPVRLAPLSKQHWLINIHIVVYGVLTHH